MSLDKMGGDSTDSLGSVPIRTLRDLRELVNSLQDESGDMPVNIERSSRSSIVDVAAHIGVIRRHPKDRRLMVWDEPFDGDGFSAPRKNRLEPREPGLFEGIA